MEEAVPVGPFVLRERIGAGGMGEVFAGVHAATGRAVAIKVVTARDARDERARAAFGDEVRAVARLDHPGIVRVLDCGEADREAERASGGRLLFGSPWLAMELLRGGALDVRGGPRGWSSTRALLTQLLEALAHAHARGVLHRDLTPRNILFAGRGARRPGLRITDFGLARALGAGEALDAAWSLSGGSEEGAAGSPHYMAPEQLLGDRGAEGPQTDLYSLGCVAYELVSGRRPFEGELHQVLFGHLHEAPPPLRARFRVPPTAEGWIGRLLGKDPRDRFDSAAEALGALEAPGRARAARSLPPDWRAGDARSAESMGGVAAGLGLYPLRPLPLVGRARARDRVWSTLREAVDGGSPRPLLIEGAAGVGKRHLLRWAAERAHQHVGARRLEALTGPRGGPETGLGPMLARELGCVGLSGASLKAKLAALPGSEPPEPDAVRAWAALIQRRETPDSSAVIRFARPEDRWTALRSLLGRLAARGPLVLVLPDLQWAPDLLGFFCSAAGPGALPLPGVCLLGTVRSEALADHPERRLRLREAIDDGRVRASTLGPLNPTERRQFLSELLRLEGPLAAAVDRRCAGNPLFMRQLVGDWVQRGLLVAGRRGFKLRRGAQVRLPDDLHALWQDRVGQVATEPGMRAALRMAAVLGGPVDRAEWEEACRRARLPPPGPLLERLVAGRLAIPAAGGWDFAGAALRESLERGAAEEGVLSPLHAACADMLAGRDAPGAEGLERRGRHELGAGRWAAAAASLCEASRLLRRNGEARRMLELAPSLRRALDRAGASSSDPRRIEARLLHARALLQVGALDSLEGILDSADLRELGGAAGATLQGLRAELARLRGEPGAGFELLEAALDACPKEALRVRAELLGMLALRHRSRRELTVARAVQELAIDLFEQAGEPARAEVARLALVAIQQRSGAIDEAERGFRELLPRFRARGDLARAATALGGLGAIAWGAGDLDEAARCFAESCRAAEAAGSPAAMIATLNVALVHFVRGDLPAAEAELPRLRRLTSREAHRPWLAQLHLYHLPGRALAGDGAGWEHHWSAVQEHLPRHGGSAEDMALVAEAAAAAAEDRAWLSRARAAWGLASEQWRRFGAPGTRRADLAAERAARLPTAQRSASATIRST